MAKFYQHMQPGQDLGKVTQLKYIDDISDDELIIYVFKDGTKSDESYIAEVNSIEAFNGRYMMVELSDPNNKWTFVTKEFNVDNSNLRNIDGVTYEVPDPGLSISVDQEGNRVAGDHIFMSTEMTDSGDGIPRTKTLSKAGKRTDSTPPRIAKNVRVEPKENYLLSLHPELLTGEKPINETVNNDILSHSIIKKSANEFITNNKKDNIINGTIQETVNNKPVGNSTNISVDMSKNIVPSNSSPITTNVIETVKHASININVDDILNNPEFDNVTLIIDGNKEEISINEFINRLKQIPVIPEKYSPFNDPSYKEDTLITNMIDKSKKKLYKIGVDIEMELPPKEVYKTIKEVYPEGMSESFVVSIAKRMNDVTLKEALAQGLTLYYENSLNKENNAL